jgi:hypothetical protein
MRLLGELDEMPAETSPVLGTLKKLSEVYVLPSWDSGEGEILRPETWAESAMDK